MATAKHWRRLLALVVFISTLAGCRTRATKTSDDSSPLAAADQAGALCDDLAILRLTTAPDWDAIRHEIQATPINTHTSPEEAKSSVTFSNLEMAFKFLVESFAPPPTEDRDFAGIIQSFEFTYELTWKTLKLIIEENGISAPFPRVVFEESFKSGLVAGNEIWKDIMESRNLSTHTYDKKLAKSLCATIEKSYLNTFKQSIDLMRPYTLKNS